MKSSMALVTLDPLPSFACTVLIGRSSAEAVDHVYRKADVEERLLLNGME
jgi:hypothetical protein